MINTVFMYSIVVAGGEGKCRGLGGRAPIRLARRNHPLTACVAVFAGLALHELQIAYRQQGVVMNTIIRCGFALLLCGATPASFAEILKCTFNFGGDLAGELALSVPDNAEPRVLLSARIDGTPLSGVASLVAIGDVEYAPLREQRSGRYALLVANRTPLLATFVALDRVVSLRVEKNERVRQLRLYDPWFAKDTIATGECK